MISVKKRGKVWYVSGSVGGKRICRSTGLEATKSNKRLAEDFLSTIYREAISPSRYTRTTVEAAAHAYATRPSGLDANTRGYLNRFMDFLATANVRYVSDITNAIITAYVSTALVGLKANSIRRALVPVRAMLNHAFKCEWIDKVPYVPELPVEEERFRFATVEEERAIIQACSGPHAYLRPLVMFLFMTGARPGEACALTWRDLNLTTGVVTLSSFKGGSLRVRTVPLRPRLIDELTSLAHVKEQVFLRADGTPWPATEGIDYRGGYRLGKDWSEIMDKAGVSGFVPYDCRHTFATRLRERGEQLDVVAKLLGHSTLRMVMRYAHIGPAQLTAAMEE